MTGARLWTYAKARYFKVRARRALAAYRRFKKKSAANFHILELWRVED